MYRVGILALALASLATQAVAGWNVNDEFSVTNGNPNGVWSYGMKLNPNQPDGALSLFPDSGASSSWMWWNDLSHISLGAPAVTKNVSASTVNGIGPGELSFHPGADGELATIRFTAPAANLYHLTGKYGAGDGGAVDALIYAGSNPLVTEFGITGDSFFDVWVSLEIGNTVDVMVGRAGSFYYDSTPIYLQIDPVPEPTSLALVAGGMALLFRRRR